MEDHQGRLDSDQVEIQGRRAKNKHDPDKLTIMVMRNVGKIRSFSVSPRAILFLSLFLIVWILISVIIFNRYFDLRFRYTDMLGNLENIEENLSKTKKILTQTEQYAAGLEYYLQTFEDSSGKIAESPVLDNSIKNSEAIAPLNFDEKKHRGNIHSDEVSLTDITVQKGNSELNLDFKLVNNRSDENATEGYIHIFAGDDKSEFLPVWNYRGNEIENGMPVNFQRGQPFLIQRFKLYQRQFIMDSDSRLPSLIKIVVYDQSGNLMLEKEFKVDDLS